MQIKLRYLNGFRDQHGRMRYYVRLAGVRHPLPDTGPEGIPSDQFLARYRALVGNVGFRRRPALLKDGFIYVIKQADRIKIGFTTNLHNRLSSIKAHSGHETELLAVTRGTRRDEERLHGKFAELKSHGEWFRAGPAMLAWLQEIASSLVWLREPMSRQRAIRYLGLTGPRFDALVLARTIPDPTIFDGRPVWSRADLDIAFERIEKSEVSGWGVTNLRTYQEQNS